MAKFEEIVKRRKERFLLNSLIVFDELHREYLIARAVGSPVWRARVAKALRIFRRKTHQKSRKLLTPKPAFFGMLEEMEQALKDSARERRA